MPDLEGINGLRESFKVVGQPNLPGRLSHALATGVAKFGVDYAVPNMLHAKFLRSPYANAKILSIDTTKALSVPGVADIILWDDDELMKMRSHGERFGTPKPLLDNIADREGAEVGCIIIAEDPDICDTALRALVVDWEVYPHSVDLLEARKEDAPIVRPGENIQPGYFRSTDRSPPKPKQGNVYYTEMVAGDPKAGFEEADFIEEYSLRLPPFAAHLPNPPGSVAWWGSSFYQGEGNNLYIEGAVREKDVISTLYGVPKEKTIQEGLFMGGKYCDWGMRPSQEITPLLAKRTGRPVRCVNTRESTFDYLMKERYMYMKVGFTKDGLITAIEDYSISDHGSRGSSSFGNVGDMMYGPYNTIKCKNVRQFMEVVDTNRGVMYVSGQHCPFNWDAVTVALHIIAEKLNMDPIEIARTNVHGPASQDDPDPVPSFEMCIEEGKNHLNWNWHSAGEKSLPDGRLHGMSFRYQMSPRHSGATYKCKLEFRDGVVHMPTQGPLFGAFVVECNAMVVAEELGIKYEDVSIDYDSREPFKAYGGGSDGTTASAWAMKECANKLKAGILRAAIDYAENPPGPRFGPPPPEPGPFKGLKPDDLDIVDGRVIIKSDPSQGVGLKDCTEENLFATYTGRPPLDVWSEGFGKKLATMNTAYCEVAVDTETGEVEILRFVAVADTGLVLRPTSLESQIDQVMYFSQGCQTMEDFIFDNRTGVLLNNNMIDYKKPGMLDVAPVERMFKETRAGNAAYGATGISHSLANTHLVIAAIFNATGVWVDPPATPDKVLKALGKI